MAAKSKANAKAKADDRFDKSMGIKEGSKKDQRIDKMVGVKDSGKKNPKKKGK